MYKVAVIGGGSSYAPELVEGFIRRFEELPVGELWLVDIEEGRKKLNIITALAERMIAKAGLNTRIFSSLDRQKALEGADFVITQFRVGQIEARILDESIPAKYGLIGQETNGAGGMFNAWRTIPVILDLIRECEQLCPNAWIVNFANPAGIITEAVFRYTKWKKFIGLCNVPIGMESAVAEILGVDKGRVRMDFAGLNHMVFALNIYLDGVNIKDQVLKQFRTMSMRNIEDIPWSQPFLEGLGVMPCPYHRYYLQKDEMVRHCVEDYQRGATRGQQVKKIEEELFQKYSDPSLDVKPKELEQRGGAYYSDAACNLIASLVRDKRDIQVVNTLNNGAIANLPDDVIVEVSSVITKDGPRPLSMGALPVACAGLVSEIKACELLACRAAITGNYEDALITLTFNPLVQSEKLAAAVLDEMLIAHAKYLPQFQEAIQGVKNRCGC